MCHAHVVFTSQVTQCTLVESAVLGLQCMASVCLSVCNVGEL